MSIRNLQYLFDPASVAIIGASERPHSVGATVLAGRPVCASIAALPTVPGLGIICTPPHTVPDMVAELGAHDTRAAIVLTAGLGALRNGYGVSNPC